MFHVLISVEVRHLKKYLHFMLKMPNCAAVVCTNHSTKNPNLSFHSCVMSDCKILRRRNPFPITSMYCSKHFEKTEKDCKRDWKVNSIIVFLYAVAALIILRHFLKMFLCFRSKYLKKACEVVFLSEPVAFSLKT